MSAELITEARQRSILSRLSKIFPALVSDREIMEAEGIDYAELDANLYYLWDHGRILWWKTYDDSKEPAVETGMNIRITAKGIDYLKGF